MSHGNAMYRKPSSGCICKGNYICTLMLISALFTISKIWIHSKCSSIDEWIKKNVMLFSFIHSSVKHTHTHTHKIQPFVTIWIWLCSNVLTEPSLGPPAWHCQAPHPVLTNHSSFSSTTLKAVWQTQCTFLCVTIVFCAGTQSMNVWLALFLAYQ